MTRFPFKVAIIATLVALLCIFGSAAWPAGPKTHEVLIEGLKFSPATLTIHRGESVRFKNADLVPHTATEKTSKLFDSGLMASGAEWKFVPTQEGTLRYICTYHPLMEGSIIVEPPLSSTEAPGS